MTKNDKEIQRLHVLICKCPQCKGTLYKQDMCKNCLQAQGKIEALYALRVEEKKKKKNGKTKELLKKIGVIK